MTPPSNATIEFFFLSAVAPVANKKHAREQPGRQPPNGWRGRHGHGAHPRPRRVGARLLPQVPEPQAGVHRRLLERRQLGGGELFMLSM